MKDAIAMTVCDSIAHLSKHGSDELEARVREKLVWMEGSDQGGCWRGTGCSFFFGGGFYVISCLFEEIEEVFSGDIVEHQE